MSAPRFVGSTARNLAHYGPRMRALWALELPQREVARRLGISQYAVSRWAYALGLKTLHPTKPRRKTGPHAATPRPTPELFRCPSCGGRSVGRERHEGCEG